MTSIVDFASRKPQRSSVTVNPNKLNQKIFCAFLAEGASNLSESKSQLPSLRKRRLQEKLQNHYEIVKSQILRSLVIQNTRYESFFSRDSNDGITIVERSLSSAYGRNFFQYITGWQSGISFSEIVNWLKNENPGKSWKEIRKHLASLEKKKELVLLI